MKPGCTFTKTAQSFGARLTYSSAMTGPIHQSTGVAATNAAPTGVPSIDAFVLGPFATNCYLVRTATAQGCWIVDPGFDPSPVIRRVKELDLRPQAVLLTHAHVDHIAGIDSVLRAFPKTPVLLHEAEKGWLSNPELNLSALAGEQVTAHGPDVTIRDGQTLTLEGMEWLVLATPGHSPGGVTFYHAPSNSAIVGDSLFSGSIGRTDFPGSDFQTLENSIKARLYTLPDSTTIYPGHGPTSSIGMEKRNNPFVRA